MPRLILLLAVLAVIYILFRRAQSMPPHKRRAEFVKLGLGVAVLVVIVLTLAGKMHWVGAALTGLLVAARQMLPTLVRLFPMLAGLRGGGGKAAGGQHSTVNSAVLRMALDHDSGELQGEVLQGEFEGWRLQDMDKAQLQSLLAYCNSQDNDSVQLLESYLQQRFPGEDFYEQPGAGPESGGDMARAEALAILGLDDSASEQDIIEAHRKLMQKVHPDRGGSDYLAARINQAKDCLIG